MDAFDATHNRALIQGARAAVREILAIKKGEEKTVMADGRLVWD